MKRWQAQHVCIGMAGIVSKFYVVSSQSVTILVYLNNGFNSRPHSLGSVEKQVVPQSTSCRILVWYVGKCWDPCYST